MDVRRALLLCTLFAVSANVEAQLSFSVRGVDEPLSTNVLNHVDSLELGRTVRLSDRDMDRVQQTAIERAALALRPYGYYQAKVTGRYTRDAKGSPMLELTIAPGEPVIVSELHLDVIGEGAENDELRAWVAGWPLQNGARLDQAEWDKQKQHGIEIAELNGYLGAAFETHAIELDLEKNTAVLRLKLITGPRYVMGDIDFGEHVLKPRILESLPRFEKGDPYTGRLMDRFRMDLWKTGYFTDVEVVETLNHDQAPPTVGLKVNLETDYRNYYQGALGAGSDTGVRLQATWSKHPMSSHGDRIDVGLGWQEKDDETNLKTSYRKPRIDRAHEFWTVDLILKFEQQNLDVKRQEDDENAIRIGRGELEERHLRLGRLKIRNLKSGDQQLFVTPFVQFLSSERGFRLVDQQDGSLVVPNLPEFDRLLSGADRAVSVGIDVDMLYLQGKAFQAHGYRNRAWLFTSNKAFGANVEFTQAYLATRRSYVRGKRWKFLMRAEVGYTDADVDDFVVGFDGEPLFLSATRLPNFYRFKAGGSASVRGYDFEQLSNNGIGSNHLIAASAEAEFRFLENWSGALFVDVGNAFNDWSEPKLKRGIGFGIRWYSIAGPIRVDFARALDFDGEPWRLHFTIGASLL